jgi:hypothetical protein
MNVPASPFFPRKLLPLQRSTLRMMLGSLLIDNESGFADEHDSH